MSGLPNEIAAGDSAAMGGSGQRPGSGVSSSTLPGGHRPPTAAGHFLAEPFSSDGDPPRAARYVSAGDPWIDRTHRTVAEADRQTAELMRGGPGRARKPIAFEIPEWVPGDLREDYVDLALQCGEEHAASVVRGLKRAAKGGRL
jgi:hypothetical protein